MFLYALKMNFRWPKDGFEMTLGWSDDDDKMIKSGSEELDIELNITKQTHVWFWIQEWPQITPAR